MATRDEKVTPAQKECLVNFMESNLEFARGKLLSIEGRLEANSLWEMLCQELNSIGPQKTVQKWQRVWSQLKTKIKRKASAASASAGRTGGGPPTEPPLSDIEEKVVFIISRAGVYGLEGPDGVPLETDQPSFQKPMPSTSTDVPWMELADEWETAGTDLDSVLSTEASTIEEPSENELAMTETPRRRKHPTKVSDAWDVVLALTEQSNKNIENVCNELYENRNVMNSILDERRSTNALLERIACALENIK